VGLNRTISPFFKIKYAFEFYYNNGRTDNIGKARDGALIFFEAKLTHWRIALNQAYRNSSFVHFSYVILPRESILNALKRRHEFEKRGVDLCSIKSSEIEIEIPVLRKSPIQPWLTEMAINYVNTKKNERVSKIY